MAITIDEATLESQIYDLIVLASTDLSPDVVRSIEEAQKHEDDGTPAKSVLGMLLRNVDAARENRTPICQDTGTNIYHVHYPAGQSTLQLRKIIERATERATEESILRPNAVDPVSGKNSGNNLGTENPFMHFEEWEEERLKIDLMLKGGGCENVSGQYKLPDSDLDAGRDLNGVYKVVVDAVNSAQGLGCAPGIIGVGIGGDRATSHLTAKKQLFRNLDDSNPEPELAEMETRLYKDLNSLGIGPMGFGGKTTVLGVKIGTAHRVPASYFVSIAYMCWAYRRHSLTIENGEVIYD
ncbi:MAG: fumarate hydratase [Candidatus Marinimicrobia bacterium]|nr:fumarate hydratase [Candidatus Neomarinimicrobiota bacterium]MCF7827837.1 fumarate hydratase [Candidatus Neomarinimicrobiota bacterium]MCF7879408.1 fumarate hydratase [Candidatus Neomarinimicrobiota bacterium]